MSKRIMMGLATVGLVVLAGCAKEPVAEVQAAQEAIAQAQSAEASVYASPAFGEAQQKMTELHAELEAQKGKMGMMRKYERVSQLAAEVVATGAKAAEEAQATKQAAMDEAKQAVMDVREVLATATAELDQAPMGKGSAADLEMLRQDLAAAGASLKEAEDSFAQAQYLDAKAKALAVLADVRRVQSEVAAAVAAKAATKTSG
jgi:small-conductance mechanosensitive channel